jgi:hypothetical protein
MNGRWVWRTALGGAAVTYLLVACSNIPRDTREEDPGAGGTRGAGGSEAASAGGEARRGGDDSPSLEIPDPDNELPPLDPELACGIGMAEATLRPVNMMIMFDRSTSMVGEGTTDPVTGASSATLGPKDLESPCASSLTISRPRAARRKSATSPHALLHSWSLID